MTCHHVIQEKFVNAKKVINFYYGKFKKEKYFKIKLDRNERFIKCFVEPFDVTMIEILKEDNINENKFLNLDLNYKTDYNSYLNDYFHLAGYPKNNLNENERSTSSGKITKILKKPEFEHSLDTEHGNSGLQFVYQINYQLLVFINKEIRMNQ